MATVEERLVLVEKFDEMSNTQKDYVASIVANEKGKRIRDISDDEILQYHKDLLKQSFDDKCSYAIEAGFVSNVNKHIYRTNRDDQINFIGQYLLVREDYTIPRVYWKTEDAGVLPLTREDFMMIYREALMHKNLVIQRFWEKKVMIDNCTTHSELRKIIWDFPTPDNTNDIPVEEPVTPTEPPITTTPDDTAGTTEPAPETTPTPEEPTSEPVSEPVVEPTPTEPTTTEPAPTEPVVASIKNEIPKLNVSTWKPSYFTR